MVIFTRTWKFIWVSVVQITKTWSTCSVGNMLFGFGFFNPYWLVSSANIFVFIHLIGGYQVFLQPFMVFVETHIMLLFPNLPYLYNEYSFHCPGVGLVPISILRLVNRSTIVCLTTVIVSFLQSGFWSLLRPISYGISSCHWWCCNRLQSKPANEFRLDDGQIHIVCPDLCPASHAVLATEHQCRFWGQSKRLFVTFFLQLSSSYSRPCFILNEIYFELRSSIYIVYNVSWRSSSQIATDCVCAGTHPAVLQCHSWTDRGYNILSFDGNLFDPMRLLKNIMYKQSCAVWLQHCLMRVIGNCWWTHVSDVPAANDHASRIHRPAFWNHIKWIACPIGSRLGST